MAPKSKHNRDSSEEQSLFRSHFAELVESDRTHVARLEAVSLFRAEEAHRLVESLGIDFSKFPPRHIPSEKTLRKRERQELERASRILVQMPDGSWVHPTPHRFPESLATERWLRKQRRKEASRQRVT